MAEWAARNQRNKAVVWEYWQRMNHARSSEVSGIVHKAFHQDVDWNGPHPINQIRGSEAVHSEFWQPLLHSFPDIKREAHILMGDVDGNNEWVSGCGYLTGTFVHDWLGIPGHRQENAHSFRAIFRHERREDC